MRIIINKTDLHAVEHNGKGIGTCVLFSNKEIAGGRETDKQTEIWKGREIGRGRERKRNGKSCVDIYWQLLSILSLVVMVAVVESDVIRHSQVVICRPLESEAISCLICLSQKAAPCCCLIHARQQSNILEAGKQTSENC